MGSQRSSNESIRVNNFNIINLHQQVRKKGTLLSNSFYDNMTLILKLRKDDTRKKNCHSHLEIPSLVYQECKVV